jgi:hypothetical protein
MVGKRLVGNLVWSVYSGRLFEVGLLAVGFLRSAY